MNLWDSLRCAHLLLKDVLDFMNATATYMEGIEWIERYAWFGYFVSVLLRLLSCLARANQSLAEARR